MVRPGDYLVKVSFIIFSERNGGSIRHEHPFLINLNLKILEILRNWYKRFQKYLIINDVRIMSLFPYSGPKQMM